MRTFGQVILEKRQNVALATTMKTLKLGSVFGISLALALLALNSASAQTYSIDWYKVAGGGGTSTGGQYVVSGTIGQHDAGGPMTGGNFSLTGGFWSLVAAIQTPGAPLLTVYRTSTNTVVISWPDPSTGFVLQQNGDLKPANWGNVLTTPTVVNGRKQVIVSPPVGNWFYRLKQ